MVMTLRHGRPLAVARRALAAVLCGAVGLCGTARFCGEARAADDVAPLPAPQPAVVAAEPEAVPTDPVAPPATPTPPPTPSPTPSAEATPPAPPREVLPADVPPPAAAPPGGRAEPVPPVAPTAAEKAAAAAVLPADVPVAPRPEATDCRLHGSVAVRYRHRSGDGERDNDLYQYVALRYRKDRDVGWSGSFYGRLAEDLDGDRDNAGFYVFDGIDDTFDSAVTGRLYHLYASYRFAGGFLERVRFGRQAVDGGYPFLIDGVHARSAPFGCEEVQVSAFAGVPAHIYEASPEGDFIGGLGVALKPWRGGDLRLDWAYLEDENEFYGRPTNHLLTGEVRHRFSEWTHGRAWYQQVDDDPRELGLALTSFSPRTATTVRGTFRAQLERENELVYDLDPYYAILLALEPYWDGHLAVAKSLSDCVTVEVGGTARRLFDGDDEGVFNREYFRAFATLTLDGRPTSCWTFSWTADYWEADDEHTFGGGFEARYRPSDRFRVTAGLDYALWRTDLYTASERFDAWGGYVKVTWAPSGCWKADLSVRVDDDDEDTYLTVNLGLRYEF